MAAVHKAATVRLSMLTRARDIAVLLNVGELFRASCARRIQQCEVQGESIGKVRTTEIEAGAHDSHFVTNVQALWTRDAIRHGPEGVHSGPLRVIDPEDQKS